MASLSQVPSGSFAHLPKPARASRIPSTPHEKDESTQADERMRAETEEQMKEAVAAPSPESVAHLKGIGGI